MRKGFALIALLLVLLLAAVQSQTSPSDLTEDQKDEQTIFASESEPGNPLVRKPIQVPEAALQILRNDLGRGATNCIKSVNSLTPDRVPASWFVASEIHLDGSREIDFVVRPAEMERPFPNRCLLGAHAVPFWLVAEIGGGYQLLMDPVADGLRILDSRTNGYRDVQIYSHTAVTLTTSTFKFDGHQYRLAEKKTKKN